MNETDLIHLKRSIALAKEALEAGDEPFGSVLVDAKGNVCMEDRNRVAGGDHTRHPEFEIARWAANNMTPEQRAGATVYTSGEHCPMCAAAHAWVGLGRIMYVSSSAQLTSWLNDLKMTKSPVNPLPIEAVAPNVAVYGPVPALVEQVQDLHRQFHQAD